MAEKINFGNQSFKWKSIMFKRFSSKVKKIKFNV